MPNPRYSDHQGKARQWCARCDKVFRQHPDREFCLTTITTGQMDHIAQSRGIFAGCATALAGAAKRDNFGFGVEPQFPKTSKRGARTVPCIVRRADPSRGRPLPEVFILDGMTAPLAPPCGGPSADVDEEAFCAKWWLYADGMKAIGLQPRWSRAVGYMPSDWAA